MVIESRSFGFARAIAIAACLLLSGAGPTGAGAETRSPESPSVVPEREPSGAYDRWSWFEDTYWIVPQKGIYSIYHPLGTDEFIVTRGQTVFHITDYFNGYFTGAVVVKLTSLLVPSCQYVLGQVTPQGRVYMTMYDAITGEIINSPLGTMVRERGRWTMVNQMTAPSVGGTLSHWAYMVQSKPGDPTFANLPFAHESIPEFLSDCPDGPRIQGR